MKIMWIIIAVFVVVTIILLSGKGSFLVAGFNTLPQSQKDSFDKTKLSRDVGIMAALIDVGLIALALYIQKRIIPAQNIDSLSTEITFVSLGFLVYVIALIAVWMLKSKK